MFTYIVFLLFPSSSMVDNDRDLHVLVLVHTPAIFSTASSYQQLNQLLASFVKQALFLSQNCDYISCFVMQTKDCLVYINIYSTNRVGSCDKE